MLAAGKVIKMEKGHLNIKQLESMKKADLQELAKKLGVSDAGTVKELAARIAEIEVDIPGESELTEEEKAAAELAAKEDETEEPATQPEETTKPEEPTKQKEPEAGKARVKAVTRYLDKWLNQIKETGEEFIVSVERAEELAAAKVVEIIK